MDQDRRIFLKTTGLAGAAAIAGAAVTTSSATVLAQAPAQGAGMMAAAREMPKGVTLCTLKRGNGLVLGVKTGRGILDVAAAEQDFKAGAPTTMDAVFYGPGNNAVLRDLADKATKAENGDKLFVSEQTAQFGPCITNPQKIICIGLNYRKHAAETGNPVPKMPILFNKFNTALNNHGGVIPVSKEKAEKFDYKAELVIVIGRTARNVSEADAAGYIFGYASGNDFTARDLQSRSSQWMLGKSLDGSAPVGPWLVSADQVDGDNLKIECRVNGEVRQSSNTSDMVFNCKQLVSYISSYVTLNPGDIIFTGTPEGVISSYPKDKQVWLKPGDNITTTIERLGNLDFQLT
jgi:2-keto-4-pentenoate hydratase/2-oxohepta-3-ene-1,7-dioic acid hydratase in catechol pathway